MTMFQPNPSPENGNKASIREVYTIVSKLEERILVALRETEHRLAAGQTQVEKRIISSMDERDHMWDTRVNVIENDMRRIEEDYTRIETDIQDLKAWKAVIETGDAVRAAAKASRNSVFSVPADWIERHWRLLVALAALAALLLDLRIDKILN